jgi:hypothetical protein
MPPPLDFLFFKPSGQLLLRLSSSPRSQSCTRKFFFLFNFWVDFLLKFFFFFFFLSVFRARKRASVFFFSRVLLKAKRPMPPPRAPWDGRPATATPRARPDARALRPARPSTAGGRGAGPRFEWRGLGLSLSLSFSALLSCWLFANCSKLGRGKSRASCLGSLCCFCVCVVAMVTPCNSHPLVPGFPRHTLQGCCWRFRDCLLCAASSMLALRLNGHVSVWNGVVYMHLSEGG